MKAAPKTTTLRSAIILTTSSSFLVPLVGLVTAPLLARALSPDGRGEAAAALAPATLILAVATLGLPEALTYFVARRPRSTKMAVGWASVLVLAVGIASFGLTWLASDFLSDGDSDLAGLILLSVALTVPALLGNIFRGAAIGRQLYGLAAIDKVIVTLWRLVWYVGLYVTDHLTVLTATLVVVVSPFAAMWIYIPRVWRGATDEASSEERELTGARDLLRQLMSYGLRVWFGAVALMILGRAAQLLIVPLSSTRELGLFSVAVTVADVPVLVAFAVQSALFGVGSKTQDARQMAAAVRLVFLVGLVGGGALAALVPFIIVPVFGAEYADASDVCLLLLLGAIVSVPGHLAASCVAAWGRPGIRSLGMTLSLAANLSAFYLFVPSYGALGAAYAGLFGTAVLDVVLLLATAKVLDIRARDFWLVRPSDVSRLRRELTALIPGRKRRPRHRA